MDKIFQNASIQSIKLKNRIIRSATHEGLGDREGNPMDTLADIYVRLAKGGAGAIITGYAGVQMSGKSVHNMRMFDDDKYLSAYKKITAVVKPYGTPLIAQIAHAGGQTHSKITGSDVVAPSSATYPLMMSKAREFTEAEIGETVEAFVLAVERAKKAGFDGVQLHAAHGYLLSEFLSPFMNRRNDRWGGSTENRFRIVAEILARARERVGDYPILAKFSSHDGDRGGITVDEGVRIAELFQKHGLDAIEVSCGGCTDGFNAVRMPVLPVDAALTLIPWMASMPFYKKMIIKLFRNLIFKRHEPIFNYNVDAAAKIKKHIDIPVIVVGGIRRLGDIGSILEEKKADFVSMCRPFIIEPDIVNKFKTGKQTESRCINCGYCLIGAPGYPLRCYFGKLPARA